MPSRPNLPFSSSGIRALGAKYKRHSARMSVTENGTLGFYGTEHTVWWHCRL